MSKPGKSLKTLCKRLGVRLTVKRGKKRVYKSVKVLKGQCAKKKKKVKRKIKRKRKFGSKKKLVDIISFAKKNKIPLGVAAGILTSFGLGYYVKKKMTRKRKETRYTKAQKIQSVARGFLERKRLKKAIADAAEEQQEYILNQPYIVLEDEVVLFGKKKRKRRRRKFGKGDKEQEREGSPQHFHASANARTPDHAYHPVTLESPSSSVGWSTTVPSISSFRLSEVSSRLSPGERRLPRRIQRMYSNLPVFGNTSRTLFRQFGKKSKKKSVNIVSFAKKNKIPLGIAATILSSVGIGYYITRSSKLDKLFKEFINTPLKDRIFWVKGLDKKLQNKVWKRYHDRKQVSEEFARIMTEVPLEHKLKKIREEVEAKMKAEQTRFEKLNKNPSKDEVQVAVESFSLIKMFPFIEKVVKTHDPKFKPEPPPPMEKIYFFRNKFQ